MMGEMHLRIALDLLLESIVRGIMIEKNAEKLNLRMAKLLIK